MNWTLRLASAVAISLVFGAPTAHAQITVNPTGVNVSHTGSSSAFLTFQGLKKHTPLEGTWCAEIDPASQCCVGSIFGQLPPRSDLSQLNDDRSRFVDVMTIPPSVSRRAYQFARDVGLPSGGASSDANFFYVRRFVDKKGRQQCVPVSCRLGGGGARSPLALTDVDLRWSVDRPVLFVPRASSPPPLEATIYYNGTGRLRGRWEIVLPGDPQPQQEDLLTEASLPPERRGTQRRYTQVGRFDLFLPPTGIVSLPGPDPKRLPHDADGLHLVLLRIEATNERESLSASDQGVITSGGVAGFAMPALRYYVGSGEDARDIEVLAAAQTLEVIAPLERERVDADARLNFSWIGLSGMTLYRLEVQDEDGPLFSALVAPEVTSHTAPPWVGQRTGERLRWRVVAYGKEGVPFSRSGWRELWIEGTD